MRSVLRISIRFIITLAITLGATTAVMAPADAQSGPTVVVNPDPAPAGSRVTITVYGVQPGEFVVVEFGGISLAAGTADDEGFFQTTGIVDEEMPPGGHPLEVNGDWGSWAGVELHVEPAVEPPPPTTTTTAPPEVVHDPRVHLDGTVERGGSSVVYGTGFLPGEEVTVEFGGETLGRTVAGDDGSWSVGITIAPDMPVGSHPLDVNGSSGSVVDAELEVLDTSVPPPTTLPPTTLPPTPTTLPEAQDPIGSSTSTSDDDASSSGTEDAGSGTSIEQQEEAGTTTSNGRDAGSTTSIAQQETTTQGGSTTESGSGDGESTVERTDDDTTTRIERGGEGDDARDREAQDGTGTGDGDDTGDDTDIDEDEDAESEGTEGEDADDDVDEGSSLGLVQKPVERSFERQAQERPTVGAGGVPWREIGVVIALLAVATALGATHTRRNCDPEKAAYDAATDAYDKAKRVSEWYQGEYEHHRGEVAEYEGDLVNPLPEPGSLGTDAEWAEWRELEDRADRARHNIDGARAARDEAKAERDEADKALEIAREQMERARLLLEACEDCAPPPATTGTTTGGSASSASGPAPCLGCTEGEERTGLIKTETFAVRNGPMVIRGMDAEWNAGNDDGRVNPEDVAKLDEDGLADLIDGRTWSGGEVTWDSPRTISYLIPLRKHAVHTWRLERCVGGEWVDTGERPTTDEWQGPLPPHHGEWTTDSPAEIAKFVLTRAKRDAREVIDAEAAAKNAGAKEMIRPR